MADEITLQLVLDEPPDRALARWREDPPPPLRDFEIVDASYNSLTFERRYLDWPAKLMFLTVVGLLFKSMMESIWRVTVRFDAQDTYGTRATFTGRVDDQTKAGLAALGAQQAPLQGSVSSVL